MTTVGETKRATPRTMRIAQMTAFRKPIQVTEMAMPTLAADGAIVRVEASGVCRSDWHFWNQDLGWMGFNLKLPANTGHEVCGVIEEVGRDVRAAKVGDRVTIPFHESDGTCPECRSGHQNLCDHVIVPGVQRLGGWAQYVTVGAADLNCIRLPESVSSLSAAALGCATAPRNTPDRDRRRPSHCSREPRSSGFVVRTMKVCVRGTSRTKPKNSAKMRVCGRPAGGGELVSKNVYGEDSPLALQLRILLISESMGNHDSGGH